MPIDVRIITATNRDLKKEIDNKNFREDLYYRICVLNLKTPLLREREDNIRLISKSFFQKYLGQDSREYIDQFKDIGGRDNMRARNGECKEVGSVIEEDNNNII